MVVWTILKNQAQCEDTVSETKFDVSPREISQYKPKNTNLLHLILLFTMSMTNK